PTCKETDTGRAPVEGIETGSPIGDATINQHRFGAHDGRENAGHRRRRYDGWQDGAFREKVSLPGLEISRQDVQWNAQFLEGQPAQVAPRDPLHPRVSIERRTLRQRVERRAPAAGADNIECRGLEPEFFEFMRTLSRRFLRQVRAVPRPR